jgi:hypothetical protein
MLKRIKKLEEQNEELQSRLDEISDIICPDDDAEEDAEGEEQQEEEDNEQGE